MKKIYAILNFLFLGGCATETGLQAILNTRMGLSEKQLIDEIGVPHKTYQLDNTKYYTYEYSSSYYVPTNSSTNVYGYGNYATSYTHSYGRYTVNSNCSITYTIENGTVTNWRYQGNDCRA